MTAASAIFREPQNLRSSARPIREATIEKDLFPKGSTVLNMSCRGQNMMMAIIAAGILPSVNLLSFLS